MDARKQKLIIIAVSVLVVGLIGIILIYNATRDNDGPLSEDEESLLVGENRVDPVSGETYTVSDREHDMFDGEDGIAYLGLSQLIERGFSANQVVFVKEKFEALSPRLDNPIEVVSIYKDSVTRSMPINVSDPIVVEFKVQLNHSDDHVVEVEYDSTSQIDTLKFYNESRSKLLHEI